MKTIDVANSGKRGAAYLPIAKTRQRLRSGLMLVWVVLMPLSLYYFSPYLPFMGLAEGFVAGSVFVFAGLFASSIFFGRIFCGWLCPAGALQEFACAARPKAVKRRSLQWIKFGLWAPWLGAWIGLAVSASGLRNDGLKPDFFFQLENGISVSRPAAYVIYLVVLSLILGLSLIIGRRAFCHTACWMAPFMILGRKTGKILRLPGLHLKSEVSRCTACGTCNAVCPMSLDVGELARRRPASPAVNPETRIASHDCIYCLRCVDACPSSVLRIGFGFEKRKLPRS